MKSMKTLCAALCLTLSAPVFAGKLAVLDVREALLTSDAAEAFRNQMKQDFASDQQALVDLEKQAKSLQQKMQKNAGLSSEDEMKQLRMQFQKAFGEYQRKGQQLQQEQSQREQSFLGDMKPKLDEIIRNMIKEEDIDLIISKNASVYVNPDLDITDEVTELLNKQ
ncbi:OmpH family outer membrane protein [Marinobacterium mangrovicola]|uniref:Periplasmic chaperone for outer membrane proteins Skp n=1 Tax=Marinobacterium mangrovicola TaxID=1476959 RepID=A0A4R1GIH7_9GAMM|nr:OmpH family outer membrane protein [Marinobacterium mangrovicola]TCK06941.1 periplasmic chaperone for outer membrane proteins Skp [Marinobacterium mangrovicola]